MIPLSEIKQRNWDLLLIYLRALRRDALRESRLDTKRDTPSDSRKYNIRITYPMHRLAASISSLR